MEGIEPEDLLALQRSVHGVIKALEHELSGLRLTASETNLLGCFEDDPERLKALIDRTGQRPSTLTSILDRLERRGLVERRVDRRDRRSLELALTPDGRRVRTKVQAAYRELAHRATEQVANGPGLSFREVLDALDEGAQPRRA